MKKAIVILMTTLLVVAFGTAVFAASEATAQAEKKEADVKTHQITGEVAAVDASASTVTVKSKKAEVVLHVTDRTKVTCGKEKKGITDLKVGDKVQAKYTEVEGKSTAKSIKIAEAPKA